MVDGDLAAARLMLQTQLATTATPDLAIGGRRTVGRARRAGARRAVLPDGRTDRTRRVGSGSRQPQVLARLLAERPGRAAEAVGLAEEAARGRADIMTMDTLAWAYFKNGQLPEAQRASTQAMRTGTRNARIRCHAEQIAAAPKAAPSSRGPGATRRCLEWHP